MKWALPAFFVSGAAGMDATISRVWELAAPLAETQGMEIIDIELRREGTRAGRVLRLYLDKAGGPNMDELSQVSRELSALLDVHDVVDGVYTLEVSSPGFDRILRTRAHFERFVGARIIAELKLPMDGRRRFIGLLKSASSDTIVVEVDGKAYALPLDRIQKARLRPE